MVKTKFIMSCVIGLVVTSLLAGEAGATLVGPVASDAADQVVRGNGTLRFVGQNPNRVGPENTTNMGHALVLVFALPTLPSGESITEADLQLNVVSKNGPFGGDPNYNIDAYGVRTSNSSSVLVSDFFMDANDVSATKIQEDMLSWLSSGAGIHNTTNDAAVGAWLSTLYTGDTPNDTYAFIRLNGDVPVTSLPANRYFNISTGDGSTNAPLLSITTAAAAVPEPSAFAFFGLTSLAVLVFRKKSGR